MTTNRPSMPAPKPGLASPSAFQLNTGTRKMTRERNVPCTQPNRQSRLKLVKFYEQMRTTSLGLIAIKFYEQQSCELLARSNRDIRIQPDTPLIKSTGVAPLMAGQMPALVVSGDRGRRRLAPRGGS